LFLQATAEFELELRNILLAWDTATERADAQLMWQLIDETLEFMQFSFAINDFEVMTKTAETHSQGWEPGLALGISLLVQGIYADMRGDNNQVRTLLQQSLTILRTQDAPRETAIALIYLADELLDKDLIDESISLATAVGDEYLINLALRTRAGIQLYYGDFSQAQVSAHQALSLALDQNDPDALGWIYQRIGQTAYFQGLYDQAQEAGQKALSIRHVLGNRRLVGLSRGILAMVASALRNYAEAEKEFKEAYALAEEVGDRVQMNFVMMNFGLMNYERGDYFAAKQMLLEVLNYRRDSGRSSLANDLNNLGHPTAALGEYAEAEGYFSEALRLAHIKSMALESVMGIANLIAKRGQKERAVALLSLVLADPRSGSEVMRLADRFLAELQAELSPEVFAAAQERGKTLDLDTVIADLLCGAE
jgi:tetratricopeptide (TPR) repeat protein